MNEWWLHPGLPAGWGAAFIVVLIALIAGLRRRLRPVEAATAAMLAVPFGAGLGLLGMAIKDCDRPQFTYDEADREIAECQRWVTHPGALVPALLLLCAGITGLWLLRRAVRGARGGSREPLNRTSFLRLVVGSIAGVLLLSVGGAQVGAAPLTMPLLFWLIAGARAATAVALTIVAALTMAAFGWFLTYIAVGELMPWSAFAPPVFAAVTIALFVRRYRHAHPRTRSSAVAASRTAG